MSFLYGRLACYIDNDKIEPLSSSSFDLLNSSGFLLGDSFFTTILAIDGQIIEGYLLEHVERLIRSFELLTEFRPDKIQLLNFIREQSREIFLYYKAQTKNFNPGSRNNNKLRYQRFRITFIRIDYEEVIHCIPFTFGVAFHINNLNSNPLIAPAQSALIYREYQITPSSFSSVKTINRLIFNLAGRRASKLGMDKAILLNDKGNIACAANANIFIIIDNLLITPPISEGVLNGILRGKIFEYAGSFSLNAEEHVLTPEILSQAEGVFLTNSINFISPVSKIVYDHVSPEEQTSQLSFSPNETIINLRNLIIKKIIP